MAQENSSEENNNSLTFAKAEENRLSQAAHFWAGAFGGALGVIVTQPLDVLKTRLQARMEYKTLSAAQRSRFFAKTINSLRYTFKAEGMRGLFKGLVPNVLGVIPSRGIYFTVYNYSKLFFIDTIGDNTLTPMLSAGTTTIVVTTIMNPIFFIKTRLQLEESRTTSNPRYRTFYEAMRYTVKHSGVRGLWGGLTASWLGMTESALYFALYENMKAKYLGVYDDGGNQPNTLLILATSGSCKLLASAATYPHEVVRTRLREVGNNNGLFRTIRNVYKHEGMRGFYSGLGAHLTRVVPNSAIMFATYETILKFFGAYQQ
mmetsp:Transcript_10786/g.15794  ORF Transcript_10786/g.15794 Transcript_10786/m.15794 type:complete len:317 (+) Transcript_10786:258-1208(+)